MQEKIVSRFSKIVIPAILLSLHMQSFGVVAYMSQTLRECIAVVYERAGSNCRKQALEELYEAIRENRMLAPDTIVSQGIAEAIEVINSSNRSNQREIIQYLEQYLNNLNDRGVLLALNGDMSRVRSWPLGLIERSMMLDQREACDLLRLSNELSCNLIFCGSEENGVSLDASVMKNIKRAFTDPSINFRPNGMTNSQSLTPTIILGGTGVNSPVINGWALTPNDLQFPVNVQFVIPDDFASHQPVSLELGFLIPNNGLVNGYANFLVQAKYLDSKHSFNPNDVSWTHANTSGNIKITEASNSDNVKYMLINIPLSKSHIKPGYFAMLSVSRTSPTGGKSEYAGDLSLVSAVFKYTSLSN